MVNSVPNHKYKKKPDTSIPWELGGTLGGEIVSTDLTQEQQESLLQTSGMQVTGASFFLRHGETPANANGDGVKGWKEPLTAGELAGKGSIARSSEALKSALGSLQNLQIHVSPTVRCLQTLQLVLQEFEVDWELTDDKITTIGTYNTSQDQQNLIIADEKLAELREKLGLPQGITLSNELNTRAKGDEEGEDLKPLFEPNNKGGGYMEAIGDATDYIDNCHQQYSDKKSDEENDQKVILFIGHRTLLAAGELAEKRDGYIPVHPQSDPGQMSVTAFTSTHKPLSQKTTGQIPPFLLPFPPADWIKQHQKLIPGLDPAKTYIENQNLVSAWMLGYAQQLTQSTQAQDYNTLADQVMAVDQSTMVAQTALSVLLSHQSHPQTHELLIQVLDHAIAHHHADTDWITTTFQRLIDDTKTPASKSESNPDLNPDLYWKYFLAVLHRSRQTNDLLTQLGNKHPKHMQILGYLTFLNTQQQQHDAIKMKTLSGEMSLEPAYVNQQLSDTQGNIISPLELVQEFLASTDTRIFITAGGGMGKSTLSKNLISLLTDPRVLVLSHQAELRVQEIDLRGYSVASLPSSQSLDPSTIVVIDGIDEIDPEVLDAYMTSLAHGVRVIGLGRHDVTHHFSADTKQYGLDVSGFESRLLNIHTLGLREVYAKLKEKLRFDLVGLEMAPLQIEALLKLAENSELSGERSNITRMDIYEYMVRDIILRDARRLQTVGSLQKFDTALYSKDKEQLFQYLIRSGYRTGKTNHVRDRSKADILALQDEYLTAYQGETELYSNSFGGFVERFLTTTSLLVHSGPTDRYRVFHETAREYFLTLPGGTVQKLIGEDYRVMRQNTTYTSHDKNQISNYQLQTMINLKTEERKKEHLLTVKSGVHEVTAIKTSAVEELILQRNTIPSIGDEIQIEEKDYIALGRDNTKDFEGWTFKSIMNWLGRQKPGALEPYIHQLDYTLWSGENRNQLHQGGIAVSKEFLSLLRQGKAKVKIQPTEKFVSYEKDYQVNLPVKTLNYNIPLGTTELIDQDGKSFHRISRNITKHYFKFLGYIKKQGQERINQHCFLIQDVTQDDQAGQHQLYLSTQARQQFHQDLGNILDSKIDGKTNTVLIDREIHYYVGSGITWSLGQDGVLSFQKGKDIGKSLFNKVKKLDQTGIKQAVTVEGKTVDVIDEATLRKLLATRRQKSTEEQLIETLSTKQK